MATQVEDRQGVFIPPAPGDPVAAIIARWQGTEIELIPLEVTYTLAAVPDQPATIVRGVPPGRMMQALREGLPKARLTVVPVAALQQAMADLQALAVVAAARMTIFLQLRERLVAEGNVAALVILDELTGGSLVPPSDGEASKEEPS